MPVSNLAPSPSRTLQILQAKAFDSPDQRAYKALLLRHHQERISKRPPRKKPSWRQWLLGSTRPEREPLLSEDSSDEPIKTELDVIFGARPHRWFKHRYWAWRLRQWTLSCCGSEEDVENDV
jgi:hypothetical protein